MFAIAIIAVLQVSSARATEDPRIELKAFRLAEDVEVSLFASEPMIANPVQMAFDARGRLWVACSPTYPHVLPSKPPGDYLTILEDTNGDGRADKNTVFADNLYVPTGFAFGHGGVYLANQPELLFCKDTDGDGRADVRETFLSGFGTEDNHHAIHVFRWGRGGKLYFQQGIFLHSNVETPHGLVRINETGGIFELEPRSQKLGVYVGHGTNPWGHAWDRWGQDFLTEAPQGGIYFLAPNTVKSLPVERAPMMASAPKSCGIEFISGRHFPDDWQGDLILNAFKNQQVLRYKLSDDGSGFAARELQPPLIASTEPNFRPVDVALGPDGALYILDWYNPIIGHMQYNFRDPRRDHAHGRVWRLSLKGRQKLAPPKIEDAKTSELVEMLRAPEAYTRDHARRELYERVWKNPNPELVRDHIAKALTKFASATADDKAGAHDLLEALWTFQTIDVVNQPLLERVLASPDPRARAAAVRVIRDWIGRIQGPMRLLIHAIDDEHPRVRLEAIVALSWIPSYQSYEIALKVLDRPMDKYLEFALKSALPIIDDYRRGQPDTAAGDHDKLLYIAQATRSPARLRDLAVLFDQGKLSPEHGRAVCNLVGEAGSPDDLAILLRHALTKSEQPALRRYCMGGLVIAARRRNIRPAGELKPVEKLLDDADLNIVARAVELIGSWKIEGSRAELAVLLESPSTPDSLRRAAAGALAALGGPDSQRELARLSAKASPAAIRNAALRAWIVVDPKAAAKRVVELWREEPAQPPEPLVAALLARQQGAEALAAAVSQGSVPIDVARLALRAVYAAGRQDPVLVDALAKAGHVAADVAPPTKDELARLVADIKQSGDPALGEVIFRRKELSCQKCHAISGAGGSIGPDLAGIGAGSPVDYIVEAVMVPSKAIREGFTTVKVVTDEGRILQGIRVRQNDRELVLKDADGNEITVRRDSIDEQREAGSLMPVGLANMLTRSELVHLASFLSRLGKPGPYATPNVPVVRRWKVLKTYYSDLDLTPNDALLQRVTARKELEWDLALSKVSGELPLELLQHDPSIVQADIEVTTPGPILLELNSDRGVHIWADETPLKAGERVTADLARGLHTITFHVEPQQRGGMGLRCEIAEAPGSPARAQVAAAK